MTPVRTLLIALLGSITIVSPAIAQSLSFQRDDIPSASGGRGIASADLNRDGWSDIVTAHHDPAGIAILLNRGASGGYAETFIALPGGPFDVVIGDLNKDGKADIAVANPEANMINVLYGNGDGTFRGPMNVGGWFNPRSLAIADMDKDGNPDLVFTAYYNRSVVIYWGDGRQSFIHRQATTPTVGVNPHGVAVADFNLDGWPDLVVANSGSGGLTVLYQNPNGSNTWAPHHLDVPPHQNVVAVGDFDHDSRPDIAAASTGTSDVTVVLNTRGGMSTQVYPSGGSSPRGIVATDLDRDGWLDLATGNRGTSTVSVLRGQPGGTFAAADPVPAGTGSRAVTAADFNNDGRIDLASANEYSASATVLSNTTELPRGGFAFRRQIMGPGSSSGGGSVVDVADFDKDGRLDAVTNGGTGMVVRFGDGRGSNPATFGIIDLAAANVNGDGHPDILVLSAGGWFESSRIETFIGDGAGNFPGRRSTDTTLDAYAMETGDFNLDGRVDLVVAGSRPQTSEPPRIHVYSGNGDGSFTLRAVIAGGESLFVLAIGDVDRDGDPDLVTTGTAGSPRMARVITRLNEGGWRFSEPRETVVSNLVGFSYGTLGDVNHDGVLDFVGAGSAQDWRSRETVAVLLGNASGFAPPTYLQTTENGLGVTIGDLTLDGHPDVMTNDGVLFKGHGDGTFDSEELFDFFAHGATIVDFNRDGLLDLVGPENLGSVQLILNQRGTTNSEPTVTLGPDFTIPYAAFFGDGASENEFWARATDPDLHQVTYTWHLPDGRVENGGTFPFWGVLRMEPGRHEVTVVVDDGRGGVGSDTIAYTVTPEKEIVLHVGAAFWDTTAAGNWQIVSDPTAAAGKAVRDVNTGQPKITAPNPAPSSYVDIGFVANASQTYKLWVRLKADGNSWSNDSLWLQFTNAVDSSGRSIAPGTSSGIEVNLEECSGCGVSGWGWRDEAWGQRDVIGTLTVRFTQSGWQQVRIQTREDGVSIDQLVLSTETYRTTRPGTVKNDTTILAPRAYW